MIFCFWRFCDPCISPSLSRTLVDVLNLAWIDPPQALVSKWQKILYAVSQQVQPLQRFCLDLAWVSIHGHYLRDYGKVPGEASTSIRNIIHDHPLFTLSARLLPPSPILPDLHPSRIHRAHHPIGSPRAYRAPCRRERRRGRRPTASVHRRHGFGGWLLDAEAVCPEKPVEQLRPAPPSRTCYLPCR